jgi:hypothetical protein
LCGDDKIYKTNGGLKHHLNCKHKNITEQEYARMFNTKEWVRCPVCDGEYYRTIRQQRRNRGASCEKCKWIVAQEKSRATCKEKYGVEHPKARDLSAAIEKRRRTFKAHAETRKQKELALHGVDNVAKRPEVREANTKRYPLIKDKLEQTIIDKYGSKENLYEQVIKKTEQTIIEKYGSMSEFVAHTANHPNFINRKSRYHKGYYVSTKTGNKEYYESSYEYVRFLQLDEDPSVFYWHKNKSQYIEYLFQVDNKIHRTYPDIFIVFNDSSIEMEEIKGFFTIKDEFRCWAMSDFCEKNNIKFRVLEGEDDLLIDNKWKEVYKSFLSSNN